jgi:hypothetical protein
MGFIQWNDGVEARRQAKRDARHHDHIRAAQMVAWAEMERYLALGCMPPPPRERNGKLFLVSPLAWAIKKTWRR